MTWISGDSLQMWASTGYTARPAQAADERSQVFDVGSVEVIYVGLPIRNGQPQQLSRPTTFRISVE